MSSAVADRKVDFRRWGRPVALALAVVITVFAAQAFLTTWAGDFGRIYAGWDFGHYLDGVRRWTATGSPYLPVEVAGPFVWQDESFLHPPIALLLFAPFLILPAILWWAIPVTTLIGSVIAWRPAPWTWPLVALCLAWPRTQGALIVGNTNLWAAAFIGLGLRFGWPGILTALKPSLAPLILIGAWRRSWWFAAGTLGLFAIPFGSLWLDWIHVVVNAPGGVLYSIPDLPLVVIPLIAWAGRRRAAPQTATASATLTARAPSS